MKNVSLVTAHVSRLVTAMSLVFAVSLSGCDDRTTTSLCKDQNGSFEGISGVYDMNFRDQDTFAVKQWKLRIIPDGQGKSAARIQDVNTKEDIHVDICNVNGIYLFEAQDKSLAAYSHARLFISQIGLHMAPLLFDKVALDAAGITNKLISIPESLKAVLGETISQKIETVAEKFASHDEQALYIENDHVPAATLLQYAKPSSAGLTWYRE